MSISLEEAVGLLLTVTEQVKDVECLEIDHALGRILAEDIKAPLPQPPFNRSPLDGYALRAEDTCNASKETPVRLKVIDKNMAGSVSDKTVETGTAVRLMTGAPIPKGADCVIRQEDTDYGEDTVSIYRELKAHDNICDEGEDYRAGTVLMKRGEKIDAVACGIIAGAGFKKVSVYRKVKAALLTSGDEVIEPGTEIIPGKIYNSNRYLIRGRLTELGFAPVWCEHVGDDAEEAAEAVKRAAAVADIVITTGGVSVGQKDIMHEVVKKLGSEKLFWRVAMKPGSPIIAYQYQGKTVISLSGNPFGAFVNLETVVRPVLVHMSMDEGIRSEEAEAALKGSYLKKSTIRRFIRGTYRGGIVEIPECGHSSGMLSSTKGCNCLIDIPAGNEGLADKDLVSVRIL